MNIKTSEDYDKIDRYLRNNLNDYDYADYSAALDAVFATKPPQDERWHGLLTQILQIADLYRNSDMTEGSFTCRVIDAIQAAPLLPGPKA